MDRNPLILIFTGFISGIKERILQPNIHPEDLLSQRAIDRRQKAGIPVPDFRDLPVNKDYLNKISVRIETSFYFKMDEYGSFQISIRFRYKNTS